MAEPPATAHPVAPRPGVPVDPADRGTLTVADRAVERVARYAAGEVDGVTTSGSNLERVVGRRYPKADAQVAGHRARVVVEVAVAWPASLPEVTAAVRGRVADRLRHLAGIHVDAVDVTAAKVVHVDPRSARRVE